MKKTKLLFALLVGLQVGFLLVWAGYHETVRRTASVVLLKVVPVDPRDIVRGQFFRLGYEISQLDQPNANDWTTGREVWVGLDPQDDGFWAASGVYAERSAATMLHQHAVSGRVVRSWNPRQLRIEYGIEEYYVPEGTPTPDFRHLTVEATVSGAGHLNLKRVLLHGKSWP